MVALWIVAGSLGLLMLICWLVGRWLERFSPPQQRVQPKLEGRLYFNGRNGWYRR